MDRIYLHGRAEHAGLCTTQHDGRGKLNCRSYATDDTPVGHWSIRSIARGSLCHAQSTENLRACPHNQILIHLHELHS